MASFDFTLVIGQAYKGVWDNRVYLARMAAIPFFVKLACLTILTTSFEEQNLWITAIVLLPSFLVEGWFLSHWARTVMTSGAHRWPFKFSGNEKKDMAEIEARGRGILSGLVSYALINFLVTGYFAALFSGIDISAGIDPENPDPRIAGIGAIFMVTSIVMFRFIWLYIPLSVNLSAADVIKKLQPLRLTFQMIGIWLVCCIPAFLTLQIVTQVAFSLSGEGENNAVFEVMTLVLRIIVDMMKNLIVTAGMGCVFLSLFKEGRK